MKWIDNITIRWKLILVAVVTSALALTFAAALMTFYNSLTYESFKTRHIIFEMNLLGAALSPALAFDDHDTAAIYLATLKSNADIEIAAVYRPNGQLFAKYVRTGISEQDVPSNPKELPPTFSGTKLESTTFIDGAGGVVGMIYLRETAIAVRERIARNAFFMLIVGVVALIGLIPVAMWLNRGIANPLRDIALATERIAKGDLEVTVAVTDRADEIGVLIRAYAEMVGRLREMTAEMSTSAGVLAETMTGILATTTQVAAGSSETATAISQTSVTMEELKQTVQMSVEKAQLVAESAHRTSQIADKGRDAVDGVRRGMVHIREQMNGVGRTILRLSEQGQAIGEIIAAVNDLADQSNLLAVNAAIEAARAGEQGRGFSVVAQEVRNLAEQSKQSTAQVRSILGEIQKATAAAVLATEQGAKVVEAGVVESEQAGDAIRILAENIETAAAAAAQITASCQEQLVGVSQVATSMESIKQASVQNAAGVRQVEQTVGTVTELGQKLKIVAERRRA
jgi:methyl-accepting chemotaxis protein